MNRHSSFIVAIYEADLKYGGPAEGGWWYEAYALQRVVSVHKREDVANRRAARLNRLLDVRINRELSYSLTSTGYSGGHLTALVWKDHAPQFWPTHRPIYS